MKNIIEVEGNIVGALLLNNSLIPAVWAIAKPSDFLDTLLRQMYDTIMFLYESHEYVDAVTLLHELIKDGQKRDHIENIIINCMDDCPSPAGADQYATMVRDASIRRGLVSGAEAIKAAVDGGIPTSEVLGICEGLSQSATRTLKRVFHVSEIEDDGQGDKGVHTGYKSLDMTISTHGWPCGQYSIVSAGTKGGKSTFLLGSAVEVARRGVGVCYATFADLNKVQIRRRWMRQLCTYSRRPSDNRNGGQEAYDKADELLKSLPITIYDASNDDRNFEVEVFAAWLKGCHVSKGIQVVFMDYAQEMTSIVPGTASDRILQGEVCSSVCRRLAAATGLPLVIGSQVTVNPVTGPMTKGNRCWEERASWVLRIEDGELPGLRTVKVQYSRFGDQGIELPFRFDRETLSLRECALNAG